MNDIKAMTNEDLLWNHRHAVNNRAHDYVVELSVEILERGLKVPKFCSRCGEDIEGKFMHPESTPLCDDCWES